VDALSATLGSESGTGARRFSEVSLIADPLYGYIEITKHSSGASERTLLDTPWVQRLRRVRQLQSTPWIFPSAEHSRFVHLLGAMHLASLFARRIDRSLHSNFPDAPSPSVVEETLRLAGLLHDVGHGPFGHFFDTEFLTRWNIDHEDIGRHLITTQLADIIGSLRSSPTGPFERGESVDPMWVAWVMADADIPGYTPPGWLKACKPILCGPATVDNLDYVPRDAYMCGIRFGPVDVARIIHYSFIHEDTLVLHSNAVGALEMFLASRLYMYTQVYHHRTSRRFDLSMHEIFADTIDLLMPGNPIEHDAEYVHLNDWAVLEAAERWQTAPVGSRERELGDKWARITSRDLMWHLAYENVAHKGMQLDGLHERILSHIPMELAARVQVDVAHAKVAPLNPMTEDGMVAIFDDLTGTVEKKRTQELIARLPQHNQTIRVFVDDRAAIPIVHDAARVELG
jgi:uncharacterized protein